MSSTDDLMGISDQDKKDYAESENAAYYANISDDEWEATFEAEQPDVTTFKWSEITLGELGLLSTDYEIEIDGDKKIVRVVKR